MFSSIVFSPMTQPKLREMSTRTGGRRPCFTQKKANLLLCNLLNRPQKIIFFSTLTRLFFLLFLYSSTSAIKLDIILNVNNKLIFAHRKTLCFFLKLPKGE
jgi:hypothetical protein